ncbi:unnamed protein product [Macrosiphum euphorbiae]|uniref:HAT C-terminal dimerisation domain-containing protein n=1 Tax=Macrosiphum euphorbiae TaxID=13131 RepID=A0AAV0Y7Q3_9HEMI|nr:unnamed protein product [Macrosiphum euphorbiae]CAI6376935.1 unnamed protein product [Macrosiphum euphorbiae]
MISANGLPISFVQSDGFKHFMSLVEPGYQIPVASTISSRLQLLYGELRAKIMNSLSSVSFVALTTDGWSSRAQESFISVTIHYINDNWELKNYTLCAEYIEERHSSENLAFMLEMVIAEWELDGKVHAVVHDNAANVVSSVLLVENVENSISCAAHTIQICVKTALKSVKLYSLILKKASTMVSHFHHSNVAALALRKKQQQLGLKELKLIQSCATRWNSSYLMCERLVVNRGAIIAVLADRDITSAALALKLEINEGEWTEMESMIKLLKPLQVATVVLCEENVTISILRPIIYGLINKHMLIKSEDNENVRNFKEDINQNLQKRFKMKRQEYDEVVIDQISCFLDPRYKYLETETDEVKENVRKSVQNVLQTTRPAESNEVVSEEISAMDFLLDAKSYGENESEFDMYLREPQLNHNVSNPLIWWKNNELKYPNLALLAKKYLCAPATSVTSERCFSTAGNIVTSKRSCLLPENVNLLTFLKRNQNAFNR